MRSIELTIDELVLHGFDPRDRVRIGDAVERELTRLLQNTATGYTTLRLDDAAHVNGGEVRLSAGGPPAATGAGIAGAVHAALFTQTGKRQGKRI